ncbi:MAG: hypothetical protein WBL50_25190 [Candidatus Acidiferrum sp.]
MMKTAISHNDCGWWFNRWNFAESGAIILKNGKPWDFMGRPLAQGSDGPFVTEREATFAREQFVKGRRQKYPFETVESE